MSVKLVINNSGGIFAKNLPPSGPERAKYIALLSAVFRANLPLFAMQMVRNQQVAVLAQFIQYQRFSALFARALLLNALRENGRPPAPAAAPRARAAMDFPVYNPPRVEPVAEYRLPAPIAPVAPKEAAPMASPPSAPAEEAVKAQNDAPPSYETSQTSPNLDTPPTFEASLASQVAVAAPSYDEVHAGQAEFAPPAYSE